MTRVPVTIKRVPFLIPFWAAAMVPARRVIWVRHNVTLDVTLLAHELVHVLQAERHPWPAAYVSQWFLTGMDYHAMPFEVEARRGAKEPFYRAWAAQLLRETGV